VSRMPFTDTHVHFFDMREPELAYDFLGPGGDPDRTAFVGDYSAMRGDRYWADDFVAETRFQNVERVVHMQAALGIADPVDRNSSSDGDVLDAYAEIVSGFSETEQRAVFSGDANRVFRLA
jgi:predicted TIM-barrel fold metal-dependent hydrolase